MESFQNSRKQFMCIENAIFIGIQIVVKTRKQLSRLLPQWSMASKRAISRKQLWYIEKAMSAENKVTYSHVKIRKQLPCNKNANHKRTRPSKVM